jgi:hypothetical protein
VLGVIINDSGSEQDISALMVENATPGVRYMIPSKHSTKVVRFDALHFIQIKSDIKCRAIVTNFTDNKAYPKYFENKIFIPHERTIYIKYYQKGSGAVTLSAMNTYDIKVEIRTLAGTKENVLVDDTMGFTCIGSVPDAKITENPQKNGSATSSMEELTFDLRQFIGKLEVIDPNESAKYQVNIARVNEVKGRFPPAKIPYITVTNTTMNDMYAMLDIKGRRYNHKITPKKMEISINLQLGITQKATNILINVLAEVVPSIVTFGYATYGSQAVKALYLIKAAKKAQQSAKVLKTFKSGTTSLTNLEKLNQLAGLGKDLENFIGTAEDASKFTLNLAKRSEDLQTATGKLDDAKAILNKAEDAAKTAKDSVKKSLQEAAEKADKKAQDALVTAKDDALTAKKNLENASEEAKDAAEKAAQDANDAVLKAETKVAETKNNLNDDVLGNLAQSKIDDLKDVTDDVIKAAEKTKDDAQTLLRNTTKELKEAEDKLAGAGADPDKVRNAQDALDAAKAQKEAAEKGLKEATDDLDVKNAANAKNKSNVAADAAKTAQKSFDDVNNAVQKDIDDLITKSDDKIKLQEKIDDIETSEKELADLAEDVKKGVDAAIAKSAKLTKQISDNQKNILESFHKIKEYKKLDISAWEKKKQNWWDSYEYIKKAMNPFEWENMKKSTLGQKLAFLFCAAAVVAPLMANNVGDTVETEETTEEDAAAPEAALDPTGEAPAPAPAPTASTETTAPPPPVIRA